MMLGTNSHFRFMGGFLRAVERQKWPGQAPARGFVSAASKGRGEAEMQGNYFTWRIKHQNRN